MYIAKVLMNYWPEIILKLDMISKTQLIDVGALETGYRITNIQSIQFSGC